LFFFGQPTGILGFAALKVKRLRLLVTRSAEGKTVAAMPSERITRARPTAIICIDTVENHSIYLYGILGVAARDVFANDAEKENGKDDESWLFSPNEMATNLRDQRCSSIR